MFYVRTSLSQRWGAGGSLSAAMRVYKSAPGFVPHAGACVPTVVCGGTADVFLTPAGVPGAAHTADPPRSPAAPARDRLRR